MLKYNAVLKRSMVCHTCKSKPWSLFGLYIARIFILQNHLPKLCWKHINGSLRSVPLSLVVVDFLQAINSHLPHSPKDSPSAILQQFSNQHFIYFLFFNTNFLSFRHIFKLNQFSNRCQCVCDSWIQYSSRPASINSSYPHRHIFSNQPFSPVSSYLWESHSCTQSKSCCHGAAMYHYGAWWSQWIHIFWSAYNLVAAFLHLHHLPPFEAKDCCERSVSRRVTVPYRHQESVSWK